MKGVVAHPGTHRPMEVVLVRPPLFLTVPEYDALCAKAVALGLGLGPDPALDRGRAGLVRKSVVAELCRRAVLMSMLGITQFRSPKIRAPNVNHPLKAYASERRVGTRFPCVTCDRRRGSVRRHAKALREARKEVRELRAEAIALRALVRKLKGGKRGGQHFEISNAAIREMTTELLEPLPEAKGYVPSTKELRESLKRTAPESAVLNQRGKRRATGVRLKGKAA